jgi:hypothetical protein
MVKRFAPIGVVSFALLAAGFAPCQSSRVSLPDAPSTQIGLPEQSINVAGETCAGLGPITMDANVLRQRQFILIDSAASSEKQSDAIFRKYFSPSSFKSSSSRPQAGGSLVLRATHAASGVLVTRSESGKTRLNTSYLLRTMASVAKDTASTPYWRRHVADGFSDFGSSVGNDAGTNLWNEFGPSIQHLMKSHAPQFVAKIGERIGHE